MLTLDYTNILENTASEGIPQSAFAAFAKTSAQHIKKLEAMRKAGKLGFADLPFEKKVVKDVLDYARTHDYPNTLVLGIGGSALGPAALDSALAQAPLKNSAKRLITLDNVDPDFIRDTLDTLKPKDTLVNIVAKSGVTAETMSSFAVVRQWMVDALGSKRASKQFVATTDPEAGDLLAIANQEGFPCFTIPKNVGGRFSVLTPVGLLPAALAGLDIKALLRGAGRQALRCREKGNPALIAAFIQHYLDQQKKKNTLVLFPYAQSLWKFAFWFKQLWGESLGKKLDRSGNVRNVGQTPTAALGVTDQHSQLQLFIEGPADKSYLFWAVKSFRNKLPISHPYAEYDSMGYLQGKTMNALFEAERQATEMALTEAGRPNATVWVDRIDAAHLGELIMFSEYMTAFAGELYDINAFDQPGVEYGKKLTFGKMGRDGYDDHATKMAAAARRPRMTVR